MTTPRWHDDWVYDPRPVDRVSFRFRYDWPSGRYVLQVQVKHHGEHKAPTFTYEDLDVEAVEEHLLVVLSSLAREDSTL
jgi:hypothetical protein